MGKKLKIYSGASGLNSHIDPARLGFDAETGITELAIAYNVDIDKTGRVSRRNGYEEVLSGDYHSLFSAGEYGLVVSGTVMYAFEVDGSVSEVTSGLTDGARVSYAKVGDVIYWMNGFEKGKVIDRVGSSWVAGDYIGPDTTKQVSDPLIGSELCAFNGRMYVASGSILWYSNAFAYSQFNLARNFIPFTSEITVIAGVAGGMWIGSKEGVSFMRGGSPLTFQLEAKAVGEVYSGSACYIDTNQIDGRFQGLGVAFTGENGIYVGLMDGSLMNVTRSKVDIPSSIYCGSVVIDNDKYVVTFKQ